MCVCIYVCMHICLCIYVYMCVGVCVYYVICVCEEIGSPGTEVTGGFGLPYVDGGKQCVNMYSGPFGKADNALTH